MDERLRQCGLFAALPEEELEEKLLPHGRSRRLKKGEYLFRRQEKVETLWVVLSGQIQLIHVFETGQQSVISVLGPAKVVGLDLAFTRTQLSVYYALAVEDTQLTAFPAALFTRPGVIPEALRAELLLRVVRMVCHDNVRKEYRAAILSQNGLRERIMTYLTMQAEKRGTNCLELPFDREGMAGFLCVNRSALSHELGKLRAEGIIAFRKNRFTLLTEEE